MKWYYWVAIAAGLLVAYVLFAPKKTVGKGGSPSPGGWAGYLTAGGSLAEGISKLVDSFSGPSDSDTGDVGV